MEQAKIRFILPIVLFISFSFCLAQDQIKVKKSAFTNGVVTSSVNTKQTNGNIGQTLVGKSDNAEKIVKAGYIYHKDVLVNKVEPTENLTPEEFELRQNYPNPFNPSTIISYQIPTNCHVDLSVYNILGQKVTSLVSKKQDAGTYIVEWDASKYSSQIYFYRIQAGKYNDIKKLILMK